MLIHLIEELNPAQILSYFNFYQVKKEKEYIIYKDKNHQIIIVFNSVQGNMLFLETFELTFLNKMELFFYLAKDIQKQQIDEIIDKCSDLKEEEYTPIQLSNSVEKKAIINAYYNLKHSEFYKGTNIENINFDKNGNNCLLLYENGNPVDIIFFEENEEEVHSEFGNNQGKYENFKEDSNTLYITYNPMFILDIEQTDSYLITKYDVDLFTLISSIKKSKASNIIINTKGIESSVYKLRILLFLWNIIEPKLTINYNNSPNKFFIEIVFSFEKDKTKKLEIIQLIESINNDFRELIKDNDTVLKIGTKLFTTDSIVESLDNITVIKTNLKRQNNIINFTIINILKKLNNHKNFKFS